MAEESGLVAMVPMKPLAQSKTRLKGCLTEQQRGDLVLGMLRRVLTVLQGTSVDVVWVMGGDWRVKNLARNCGAQWIEDPGRGLNDTLSKAFHLAASRGMAALYLAGDLPFLKPADVHTLVRASRRNNLTLAPARRDGGTNSILVPRGVSFRPQLGPRSFTKHLSELARLEISVAICSTPGLGFDLDTIADLEVYQHMEPGLLERLAPTVKLAGGVTAVAEGERGGP